jgi:hypothetical protein
MYDMFEAVEGGDLHLLISEPVQVHYTDSENSHRYTLLTPAHH